MRGTGAESCPRLRRGAQLCASAAVFRSAVFLAIASGALAADPAAELSRLAKSFQDGRAHTADFTQSFLAAGFTRAQKETGVLTVQAPENLRFDYHASSRKIFTFDGQTVNFYSEAEKQMVTRRISADERATLPLVFLESPEALGRAYELSAEEKGSRRDLVLKPRASGSEIVEIRLSLAPDGSPAGLSYRSASGDRTEFDFGAFRAGLPRPAADFRLQPPAGTRIVASEH